MSSIQRRWLATKMPTRFDPFAVGGRVNGLGRLSVLWVLGMALFAGLAWSVANARTDLATAASDPMAFPLYTASPSTWNCHQSVVNDPPLEAHQEVYLLGEFHQPGGYRLLSGETLFELILRSGGLTPEAYPYGAVMTRGASRHQSRQRRAGLLRDLEMALVGLQSRVPFSPATLYVKHLLHQFQQPGLFGRVIVQADPAILQVRRASDTILMKGDVIYMPQRMNAIQVVGEVLNAGSFPFVSGGHADDYIESAGGMTAEADVDQVFAVLPNGLTQSLKLSYWHYTPVKLAPGSMIVVPRIRSPYDDEIPMHDIQRLLAELTISSMINPGDWRSCQHEG